MSDVSASSSPDLLEVVSGCHKLLSVLDLSTRSKAIKMLLLAFDEPEPPRGVENTPAPPHLPTETDPAQPVGRINRRVQYWLKKYDLREQELERVLDLDGDYSFIAHLPGDSKREQATGCYLLAGLQAMLRTGEPKFRDEDAVNLCRREGCYDRANHSTTRAQLGKRMTGDKESAFTLTTLGLEQAATLVKRILAE
jgi:hypothetical protein